MNTADDRLQSEYQKVMREVERDIKIMRRTSKLPKFSKPPKKNWWKGICSNLHVFR